jgi:hypothetical protein
MLKKLLILLLLFPGLSCSFGYVTHNNMNIGNSIEHTKEVIKRNQDVGYFIIRNYKEHKVLFDNVKDCIAYADSLNQGISFDQYQKIWFEKDSDTRIVVHYTLKEFVIDNIYYKESSGLIVIIFSPKTEVIVPKERNIMFSSISFTKKSAEVGPDPQFAANGYYADLIILD